MRSQGTFGNAGLIQGTVRRWSVRAILKATIRHDEGVTDEPVAAFGTDGNAPIRMDREPETSLLVLVRPLLSARKPLTKGEAELLLSALPDAELITPSFRRLAAALGRFPQRSSRQEVEDLARAAHHELIERLPIEPCPMCGEALFGAAMVLAHREDDGRRTCFIAVRCQRGHAWQRWADRPKEGWSPSAFFHDARRAEAEPQPSVE